MEKTILHVDLNSFFASVELIRYPELRGKPVAVCGSSEERHGIVLAKSEEAKALGVKTAEAIWEAKAKAPDLIIVPPTYSEYHRYSLLVREIMCEYTDFVEPFGIDEAWLDVTGSERLFGTGEQIAEQIRTRVKAETGLTVSIGVSFNKVFAKLGSDMKKPDAVTVISSETFREKVWQLPVGELLGVGRITAKKLSSYGISTIGDLAKTDAAFLEKRIGKNGRYLWYCANGLDNSPVVPPEDEESFKSVGHGHTASRDLSNNDEVKRLILSLSEDIAKKLRRHNVCATGVRLSIKDNSLKVAQFQQKCERPVTSFKEIATAANQLFISNYSWGKPVRSLTVTVYDLIPNDTPVQLDLSQVDSSDTLKKNEDAEKAIEAIRNKYGKKSIDICSIYNEKY